VDPQACQRSCVGKCRVATGVSLSRNRCVNGLGETILVDPYQWPLTHCTTGKDKALKLLSVLVTRGRQVSARLSAEQSIAPPGKNRQNGPWLSFTRLSGAFSPRLRLP
jgi:hypothetical protein